MRRLRTCTRTALVAAAALLGASRAGAQSLGPQRQFLAIEPYYEYTRFDLGESGATAFGDRSGGTTNLNGYGARLWINGAPFHAPGNSAIALFTTYAPSKTALGASVLHYGVQVDEFFVRRPLGGRIDPFVSVGIGALRYGYDADQVAVGGTTETHIALSPGAGVRVPFPNRFELRADVRDLVVFSGLTNVDGTQKTTNNLVVQTGVGVTF